MAKILSIALQKGGTAKTTTAINLAANLAYRKKKVLLIDMDFQANATFGSGIDQKTLEASIYNVLTPSREYNCSIASAILHTDYYDLLPADKDVVDLQLELKSPTALKESLASIKDGYDYIVIDCPPAVNIISQNVLVASDYIIIPSQPKPFNFTGMVDMRDTLESVQKRYNPKLSVLGILLVMYNNRTNLTKLMQETISNFSDQMHTTVYETSIREGVAVSESQLAQKPLIYYAPSAKPTIDYKAFTTETLKRLGDI